MSGTGLPYVKLVGAGNDFVLVEARDGRGKAWPDVSQRLCDRRRGIGADGLLVLDKSKRADVRMRIFNPDGSEPSMCGNGIRCLAWYAHQRKGAGSHLSVETAAGVLTAQICGPRRVRIDMGRPVFEKKISPVRAGRGAAHEAVLIDSGVPHLVVWTNGLKALNVSRIGRGLRRDSRLGAAGANIDFITVKRGSAGSALRRQLNLSMRTYERGVEAETQACGTGAVAAAAAAVLELAETHGRSRLERIEVMVRVPGGRLGVTVGITGRRKGRPIFTHASLEGEARQVSQGTAMLNGREAI